MNRKPAFRHPERHAAFAHPRSIPIESDDSLEARESEQPFEEGSRDAIDPDLRHRMISEAAYARYAERGYADGYDIEDWLAAETEVDHVLLERAGSAP
jgi:hypothetical protein